MNHDSMPTALDKVRDAKRSLFAAKNELAAMERTLAELETLMDRDYRRCYCERCNDFRGRHRLINAARKDLLLVVYRLGVLLEN